MKNYLTAILILLTIVSSSQNIEIFNYKSEMKIIPTDFLEVGVRIDKTEKCCNYIRFEGYFSSTSKDSITFNFTNSIINQRLNSVEYKNISDYLNNDSRKVVAKNDILYIKDYISKKNKKRMGTMTAIGGILMFGGVLTALNALVLADNNKNDLLLASGVQIGTGLVIGLSFSKSQKKFKETNDPWRFK